MGANTKTLTANDVAKTLAKRFVDDEVAWVYESGTAMCLQDVLEEVFFNGCKGTATYPEEELIEHALEIAESLAEEEELDKVLFEKDNGEVVTLYEHEV